MPTVNIPDKGIKINFPDSMSAAEIDAAIKKDVYGEASAPPPSESKSGDAPEWAGRHPNLYGLVGAGKEILRTGIEAGGTTLGAAGGAFIPVPGASLAGAGVGYAAGKRAANALFDEPVDTTATGMLSDVALGGLFQGAGKLVGKIPGVNKILSPDVAGIGPEKAVGSGFIDKTASAMMEKSMKIPPSVKQVPRETAIKTALNEEVPITKGGLDKVKGLLDDLTEQMDSAVGANPNAPIATDSVLGPVKEFQQWISGAHGGSKLAKEVQAEIDLFKQEKGDVITLADAQEWKKRTGVLLRKNYGELATVAKESQKQLVRGMKDRIAQEIPEIAGINARYSDLKVLEQALERAVNRTGNWDWFSLSAGMAGTIVGGSTGSLLKATEAVGFWRLLKSPVVQSRLAIILKRNGAGSKANALANTITETVYNKMTERGEEQP